MTKTIILGTYLAPFPPLNLPTLFMDGQKKKKKRGPLTNNDLPVLPIVGDLVTRAELGEAGAPHDEDNNPGHVLGLGGPGGGVLAMPASISTTAIRNNMNE